MILSHGAKHNASVIIEVAHWKVNKILVVMLCVERRREGWRQGG